MRCPDSPARAARCRAALALLCVPLAAAAQFQNDDLLVGRRDGQIDVYRGGMVVRSLSIGADNLGYTVRGLCFSTNRQHLYVTSAKHIESTGVTHGRISRFGPGGALLNASVTTALQDNEVPRACAVDIDGNLVVELRGVEGVSSVVARFDPQGAKLGSYSPSAVGNAYPGLDLLQDQRTLVYAAGLAIRRYRIGAGQLDNLATVDSDGAAGAACTAVRARANGEIWALCGPTGADTVMRFDAGGGVIRSDQRVRAEWGAPFRFSSDGTSFWTQTVADFSQQWSIVKRSIDGPADAEPVAQVEVGYGSQFQATQGAFAVYGERTAATTECADGIDNDGDGRTDFPDDLHCSGRSDPMEGWCFKLPFSANVVCVGPWRRFRLPSP
jgi:hypothetical protein